MKGLGALSFPPTHPLLWFMGKDGLFLDERKNPGGQEENTISEGTEGNCGQELMNGRM